MADKAFVSGDSFYRNQTGDPVIPFGTITVVETKAPEGYVLPKPGDSNYKVFLTRFVPDSAEPDGIRIEGDMNGVQQGNEPKHREQVMRGDIELTKYMRLYEPDRVVETGAAKPEPRAIFDFYASRDFTGTRPTDGAAPAFWLQTDEEGRASTIDAGIYLIQNPNGSYELRPRPADATGGLPYDSYLCVQRTTDPAYQKCEPLIFTVNQDGMLATTELYDDAVSSAIRVVKVDAETGEVIAYPASWQIYSQQTNRYVKMDDGKGMTDTFRSDDSGQLLLPEALPYGSYLLHEVEAPRDARVGYVLNTTDLPFFVTEVRDIDNPLVITAKDVPAKGTIGLSKTGSRRGAPVAGAEYAVIARSDISTLDGTLRAAAGETVAVLVTDEQGKAVSAPLYLGDYLVVETRAPKGYQKDETEYPVELLYEGQQVAVVEAHLNLKDDEITIEGGKRERKTEKPIPDTEFTLYREREAGSDVWEPVDVLLTDADGKAVFSPVMPGSYKLVETRPNPSYASCEESGEKGTRYLTIDENSTSEVQIFYNTKIQLGCEIYEDTINVTAAAFKTNDEDYLRVENVGAESYHYTLDFRSTSNVRADEFTVIDRLESVITGSVRLKEVFTPVARGDSDGFFNLWYQTNLTDSSRLYSSANAMSSNPFNANNPNKRQNWPSVGWKLWQENIPTTVTTRLLVDDLGLAQGEYVTALRFEYGSVEVGFTTRDTVKQALQNSKESKPLTSDWSTDSQADNKDSNGEANKDSLSSLAVPNLKPATYLVICSTALLPPTTIRDSAIVHIARNIVLSDEDVDAVETRVIEPFMTKTTPTVPTDLTTLTGFEKPGPSRLPSTGDHATYQALMAVLSFALLSAVFLHRAGVRRSPRRGRHFLDKSSVSNGG
ncbi:MAG: hypothetical protein LBH56_02055 [Coriobacteriales bacterium]|nr:hypothetical protein [Coriobacteriales bacterium]